MLYFSRTCEELSTATCGAPIPAERVGLAVHVPVAPGVPVHPGCSGGGGGALLGVVCIAWCLATLRVLSWLAELLYIPLCEEDVDADVCLCLCPLLSCMVAILLLISYCSLYNLVTHPWLEICCKYIS